MSFQPLGEGFTIRSPLAPAEAKAAIRAERRSWFAQTDGPRGWIIGPFLCLWNSAFNQTGPMVLARISSDGSGTRISGRAGSDLNGTLYVLLIAAMLLLAVPQIIANGDTRSALWVGGCLLLFSLSLWFVHKDRREARPMVAFLRRTLADKDAPRLPPSTITFPARTARAMRMSHSVSDGDTPAKPQTVQAALRSVAQDRHGFVVLMTDTEHYIQTRYEDDGFILEKRHGSEAHHFVAIRTGDPPPSRKTGSILTLAEVEAAFAAYCAQAPTSSTLAWHPLNV